MSTTIQIAFTWWKTAAFYCGLYRACMTEMSRPNWLTDGHTPRLERHDLTALSTSEGSGSINVSLLLLRTACLKFHCIGCLWWRPVTVLTESICKRPAIIWGVDMPAMATAVEAAPLVECAENTSVSKSLTSGSTWSIWQLYMIAQVCVVRQKFLLALFSIPKLTHRGYVRFQGHSCLSSLNTGIVTGWRRSP